MQLLDYRTHAFSTLLDISKLFSSLYFYNQWMREGNSHCFLFSPTLDILILLDFNFLANLKVMLRYLTVVWFGFHFLTVRLSILLFLYWQFGFLLLINCLINILCLFFLTGCIFFLFTCSCCLYTLDTNPLSVIWGENMSYK